MKEDLIVEFKSDIKKYSDTDLIDETGKTKTDQKRVELAANLLGIPLKELYSEENKVYDSSENLLETLVRKDNEIAELQNNLSSARTIIESQKQTIDALKELKVIYEKQLGL